MTLQIQSISQIAVLSLFHMQKKISTVSLLIFFSTFTQVGKKFEIYFKHSMNEIANLKNTFNDELCSSLANSYLGIQ